MKSEHAAHIALQDTAAERARWAAVLAPRKPASPEHAAHIARGARQGFRPVGRFQWLAFGMICKAGPR